MASRSGPGQTTSGRYTRGQEEGMLALRCPVLLSRKRTPSKSRPEIYEFVCPPSTIDGFAMPEA